MWRVREVCAHCGEEGAIVPEVWEEQTPEWACHECGGDFQSVGPGSVGPNPDCPHCGSVNTYPPEIFRVRRKQNSEISMSESYNVQMPASRQVAEAYNAHGESVRKFLAEASGDPDVSVKFFDQFSLVEVSFPKYGKRWRSQAYRLEAFAERVQNDPPSFVSWLAS